jgi:phosphohistidine phosphatase
MDLILWRHAEAEDGTELISDLARRLTPKGHKQASKMAYWLDRNLPESCKILVSPAARTLETVAALERKFKIVTELSPDANWQDVLALTHWPHSKEPVLIVGHQPYLGQIAAHLIAPNQLDCSIRKGNVWWIKQKIRETEGTHVYLKAIMSPDLVVR